jgi:putative flippase GtrA
MLTHGRERTRFLKFAVVGTIGAAVDFSVFNLLFGLVGMPGSAAQVVSFTIAVCSNFLWNRYWTYPDSRTKRIRRQITEFFIVNLIGVVIRTPIFVGLERVLQNLVESVQVLALFDSPFWISNAALAGGMIVVLFWNFFANRYWTYADIE